MSRCRCAVGILVIEVAFISLALFRSHWPKILYVRRNAQRGPDDVLQALSGMVGVPPVGL